MAGVLIKNNNFIFSPKEKKNTFLAQEKKGTTKVRSETKTQTQRRQ